MNPIVRIFGKVLRLVGISSPEDALPKERTAADPPSWRSLDQSAATKREDPKR